MSVTPDGLPRDSVVRSGSVAAGGQAGFHALFGSLKFPMTGFQPFRSKKAHRHGLGTPVFRQTLADGLGCPSLLAHKPLHVYSCVVVG